MAKRMCCFSLAWDIGGPLITDFKLFGREVSCCRHVTDYCRRKKTVRNHHDYQIFYNCHSNSGRWWKNAINMARFNLQKNRVSQVFGHIQPNSSTWKIGGAFAMSSNFILEYSSSTWPGHRQPDAVFWRVNGGVSTWLWWICSSHHGGGMLKG